MYNFRSVFFSILLLFPLASVADQSWKINLNEVEPVEAIAYLDAMFNLTAVNPNAQCLASPITFVSDKLWHQSEAKELIGQIVQEAGCRAVLFEGNKYVVQGSVL
tara:strand:- start:600 stop:914 length:315 start_codon:yes stop_codon:yes gene_type:complete